MSMIHKEQHPSTIQLKYQLINLIKVNLSC